MCEEWTTQQRNVSLSPAQDAAWPFGSEGARLNHEKACRGTAPSTRETRAFEKCGREFSKANIARHRRACTAGEGESGVRGDVRPAGQTRARVFRASWKPCPQCGSVLSAASWRDICADAEVDDGGGGACLTKGEGPFKSSNEELSGGLRKI